MTSGMLTLRGAHPDEAAALTELCLRSKAVWGYDAAFMAACRDELTLTPETFGSSLLQVAVRDGRVIGMVQVGIAGEVAQLDRLFVEPDQLRSGAGRILLDWAKAAARQVGAVVMIIEADPGAAGFYRREGAVDAGTVASGSIPGRCIPKLSLAL
ncbi:GNAT family N-acetyltransferase [Tardiphaga sp. 1201_B9_N1_1]|jgi:GNAT superfamily N-acetyltransferase|uniref:GNAT family N-acetyltransferase n=1 Tax=unclassified Tardiphaga TaxID=2631404 RepID=UPI000FED352F